MRLRLVVVLMLISPVASAGPNFYSCEVGELKVLSDNGALVKPANYDFVGLSFLVDRESGVILGDWLGTAGEGWEKSVVDRGGSSSGFKVISLSRAGLASYLLVKEWIDGHIKPFILVFGDNIVSGACE